MEMWKYEQRLAYTRARNGIVPRRPEASPLDPQQPGISVGLNPKDQAKYDQERDKARKRGVPDECAKFLSSRGIDPSDVLRAIELQQPFSGPKSTILRIDAGVEDFDTDAWRNLQKNYPDTATSIATKPVALDFKNPRTGFDGGIWVNRDLKHHDDYCLPSYSL